MLILRFFQLAILARAVPTASATDDRPHPSAPHKTPFASTQEHALPESDYANHLERLHVDARRK